VARVAVALTLHHGNGAQRGLHVGRLGRAGVGPNKAIGSDLKCLQNTSKQRHEPFCRR
jgi:hypothetical protein